MVGLADITPAREKVDVNGEAVEVYGISAAGLGYLIRRFPEIRKLLSGREISVEEAESFGPECVAAIIASGCGAPGDEKAEAVAKNLPVSAQADLLEAILRVTMPGGVQSIVGKVSAVTNLLGGDLSVTGPDTKSLKQSSS